MSFHLQDSISLPSAEVQVPTLLNRKRSAEASSVSSIGDIVRPDAKTRRYDRQLRLWGASGQGGLEDARVLLINPVATGTQSLKNLVLPGIGYFEILSDKLTTAEDIGQNFFLTTDSLDKALAEETVKYLRELNPSVVGKSTVASVDEMLTNDPAFFLGFTLIIAANVSAATEERLSSLLWSASDPSSSTTSPHPDIPLILVRSSGFMGTVRVQIREHTIVDTHPTSLASLRIDQPFPELLAHVKSIDFDSLDSMDHGNIPFVIILIKALEDWKATHGGEQPKWSGKASQKKEFLKTIDQARRHGDEENYAEAMEKAFLACQVTKVPSDISALLTDPSCTNVDKNSKPFFLLLAALSRFVSATGLLPLSSSLPDMKSDTARYVHLQTLYKNQAKADLDTFKRGLAEVLIEVGLEEGDVATGEIEEFVKNAGFVKVVRGRSLQEERSPETAMKDTILSFSPDPTWNVPYIPPPITQYIAFQIADRFHAHHNRYPGRCSSSPSTSDASFSTSTLSDTAAGIDFDTDLREMESLAEAYLCERGWHAQMTVEATSSSPPSTYSCSPPDGGLPGTIRDALGEMVRASSSDLPTTAAFLGGLVAQETIKLLTNQYVPLNNTTVVDLIRSSTAAYEL